MSDASNFRSHEPGELSADGLSDVMAGFEELLRLSDRDKAAEVLAEKIRDTHPSPFSPWLQGLLCDMGFDPSQREQ